jgi:hypothetical protein
MVGARPDGQLQHRDVDGARMAYVSGILFIQEDSPDEIGTAVAKFVCNSRQTGSSRRHRKVKMDGDRSDLDRKPSSLSLKSQSSTGPDTQGRDVYGGESLNVKAFRRQLDVHWC